MPWHWVEKHREIDLLLQGKAAERLPPLERVAKWLRIEQACRAVCAG